MVTPHPRTRPQRKGRAGVLVGGGAPRGILSGMLTRNRAGFARGLLVLDGVGCAAAGGVVLASKPLVRFVDPSLRARVPLAVALGATSALLLAGARRPEPANPDLERAAAVNAAWAATCLVALARPASTTGAVLIAVTAVLDGATGAAQWLLRET